MDSMTGAPARSIFLRLPRPVKGHCRHEGGEFLVLGPGRADRLSEAVDPPLERVERDPPLGGGSRPDLLFAQLHDGQPGSPGGMANRLAEVFAVGRVNERVRGEDLRERWKGAAGGEQQPARRDLPAIPSQAAEDFAKSPRGQASRAGHPHPNPLPSLFGRQALRRVVRLLRDPRPRERDPPAVEDGESLRVPGDGDEGRPPGVGPQPDGRPAQGAPPIGSARGGTMQRRIFSPIASAAAAFFLCAFAGGQAPAGEAARAPSVETKASQAAMTPKSALARLEEGNARFAEGRGVPRNLPAKVAATAAGQYPFAAIVSCMDSRAPVEIVFDQSIGDVFSLRVAGNVIDPNFLGSLEYAAKVVGVRLLVVLGHSHCGAVKGAIDGVKMGNLTGLLAEIQPAIDAAGPKKTSKDAAYVARVAEQNVRVAMKEIRDRSPILKEMLDSGALGLVGGMYDLDTGRVTFYRD